MNQPARTVPLLRGARSGFALILTLSVLTVVIALTGVLTGYLNTARKEASGTRAMIQANLYFADTKAILSRFKERKTLYTTLYLSPIPLQSKDGSFSLILQCHPMEKGLNINWFAAGNNPAMQSQYHAVQKVFDALMLRYEVQDPARLEEMIQEAAASGMTMPQKEESRQQREHGMISFQSFAVLLERYAFETGDERAAQIPWQDYFVFHPASSRPKENLLAGDYLSADLLSLLFDIEPAEITQTWSGGEGALKDLLAKYGIVFDKTLFSEAFIDRSLCDVDFDYQGDRYRFAFVDKEGEVNDFVFYGKE